MAGLHPAWILTALILTFLLISIIPLFLIFIMTCVVGPPTDDPTPDLVDRSLQMEARLAPRKPRHNGFQECGNITV